MERALFFSVFTSVFLAEIGDKTQLATMTFAARTPSARWTIFAASAGALTLAAGIGVLFGDLIAKLVSPRILTLAAGIAFVLIGAWTIVKAARAES